MVIRILGVIVGLCFVAPLLFDIANPKKWVWAFMGVAFIAYGLGGQSLLSKVAPGWAKKPDGNESQK
jgi:hypothetical protein